MPSHLRAGSGASARSSGAGARRCDLWQAAWADRLSAERGSVGPATLRQLVERFIQFQEGQVAPTTIHKYRDHMARWYAALGAETPIEGIGSERIAEARRQLARDLAAVTVNSSLTTLKRILNFAFEEGWLTGTSPCKRLRALPEPDREATWWAPDEVSIALRAAAADEAQPAAVLLILLGTHLGLRLDEMANLRWKDLHLVRVDPKTQRPAPVCHIRNGADWSPKTGTARTIPISAACLDLLTQHRKDEGYVLREARTGEARWVQARLPLRPAQALESSPRPRRADGRQAHPAP